MFCQKRPPSSSKIRLGKASHDSGLAIYYGKFERSGYKNATSNKEKGSGLLRLYGPMLIEIDVKMAEIDTGRLMDC